MVEEIKKEIKAKIAKLESERKEAVTDHDFEFAMELKDKIIGLEMAQEIIERVWQHTEGRGKNTKVGFVKGLEETGAGPIIATTKKVKMTA